MGGREAVYGALVPSIPPRMEDIRTTSVPPYLELHWGASAPPTSTTPSTTAYHNLSGGGGWDGG